jgi:hypothetical protein
MDIFTWSVVMLISTSIAYNRGYNAGKNAAKEGKGQP